MTKTHELERVPFKNTVPEYKDSKLGCILVCPGDAPPRSLQAAHGRIFWACIDIDEQLKFYDYLGSPIPRHLLNPKVPHINSPDLVQMCKDVQWDCRYLHMALLHKVFSLEEYRYIVHDLRGFEFAVKLACQHGMGRQVAGAGLLKRKFDAREEVMNRLTPLIETYQTQVHVAGGNKICLPVFSRGAAYLKAHLDCVIDIEDSHVDQFLFDFCQQYTVHVDGKPGIGSFDDTTSVDQFARSWKPKTGTVVFGSTSTHEPVFTIKDLDDLVQLHPVACMNVTQHAPTLDEAYQLGYLRWYGRQQ